MTGYGFWFDPKASPWFLQGGIVRNTYNSILNRYSAHIHSRAPHYRPWCSQTAALWAVKVPRIADGFWGYCRKKRSKPNASPAKLIGWPNAAHEIDDRLGPNALAGLVQSMCLNMSHEETVYVMCSMAAMNRLKCNTNPTRRATAVAPLPSPGETPRVGGVSLARELDGNVGASRNRSRRHCRIRAPSGRIDKAHHPVGVSFLESQQTPHGVAQALLP
uniref:Uncharacterized protein n=1 Tax=Psilocybe cubensis TaxID=181762 RepID=A0A8H8CHY8_PSICU